MTWRSSDLSNNVCLSVSSSPPCSSFLPPLPVLYLATYSHLLWLFSILLSSHHYKSTPPHHTCTLFLFARLTLPLKLSSVCSISRTKHPRLLTQVFPQPPEIHFHLHIIHFLRSLLTLTSHKLTSSYTAVSSPSTPLPGLRLTPLLSG